MSADSYPVGKPLGETEIFRVYECKLPDGDPGILKIVTDRKHNAVLDREAFILGVLLGAAARLEKEFQRQNPGKSLNYGLQFPNLVDSFISSEQGDRRINIVRFPNIKNLSMLVPIGHIITRDRVRVDPKTSAWIMGKLLKVISFAHDQKLSIGRVTDENVLLERDEHYVVIFDWSEAKRHTDAVPNDIKREEIQLAANFVLDLLEADCENKTLPKSVQLDNTLYSDFLFALANGQYSDAFEAHKAFYSLIRTTLGWSGYHPYTSEERNK